MDMTFEKNILGTDFTVSTRISTGLRCYIDKNHDGFLNPIIESYLSEQVDGLEIIFRDVIKGHRIKTLYSCHKFMTLYSPFGDMSVRINKNGEIHGRNFAEVLWDMLKVRCDYISGTAGKPYKIQLVSRENSNGQELITSWELETVRVKNSRTITVTEPVIIKFSPGKVIDIGIKNKEIRQDVLEKIPVFMCRFVD